MQTKIFQARTCKQRKLYGTRRTRRENLRAVARLDGLGNIAIRSCNRITAQDGKKRRNNIADGVFIVAHVPTKLRGKIPFFQLRGNFRRNARAIGKLGTDKRRKQLQIPVYPLPKIKRHGLDGKLHRRNLFFILLQRNANLFFAYFFYTRKIKRRKKIVQLDFHYAFVRDFFNRLFARNEHIPRRADGKGQSAHPFIPRIFNLQGRKKRSAREIIGIRNHLHRFPFQGKYFF